MLHRKRLGSRNKPDNDLRRDYHDYSRTYLAQARVVGCAVRLNAEESKRIDVQADELMIRGTTWREYAVRRRDGSLSFLVVIGRFRDCPRCRHAQQHVAVTTAALPSRWLLRDFSLLRLKLRMLPGEGSVKFFLNIDLVARGI